MIIQKDTIIRERDELIVTLRNEITSLRLEIQRLTIIIN